MRQIARETGCRFGGLLHVDSLTDAQGEAPTFLQLLEVNNNTLLKALAAP
jgi:manganese/iron transport system substrate-binding protein